MSADPHLAQDLGSSLVSGDANDIELESEDLEMATG